MEMRLFHVIRRARIAAVAAAMLTTSVSAFGQIGQPPTPSANTSILASAQAAAAQAASQPDSTGPVRRLSMDDAVTFALEQNLGIRIQRLDPQVQDLAIAQAKSSWTPQLSTTVGRSSNNSPTTSILTGTAAAVTTGRFATGTTLNESLPWGGSYSVNWNNNRVTTSDPSSLFNPQLNSNFSLNYSQPLVRNRTIDQIRQLVENSVKLRDLSDIQLQQVVTGTMRNVRNAYWDLAYSINNLKAQQQSLALSQQSLKDNQKRVEIGTMAPIDIVQAQAEVASNEQGVIIAEANIKTAQDNLRALILDPSTPEFWNVSFEPTDAPSFEAQAIDVDAAVRNALDKRSDLKSAKNSLAQSDINIRFARNQILPDVNAQVTYGAIGVGGTQYQRGLDALTGTTSLVVAGTRGYGSALGDLFQSAFPNWTVGVQFGYPLGRSTAEANLARARLQYDQSQTQLKSLEVQVATQVRAIARNVQTNQQRVRSARASRELQEKKLEAEEKKLAAGMSQSFFVFQAQRDLSLARTAELLAISDYNKSLVDFDAVQLVPLGGGGGGITIAGR
jgi:outer membrane protein